MIETNYCKRDKIVEKEIVQRKDPRKKTDTTTSTQNARIRNVSNLLERQLWKGKVACRQTRDKLAPLENRKQF